MKTMAKEHNLLNVDKAGPAFTVQDGSGWRQMSAPNCFVSESYFDLKGLAIDEKTLFFEGATVQELQNPSHVGGAAGDLVQIVDIMSDLPLTDTELLSYPTFGNTARSQIPSFECTIYARNRLYIVDLDFAAGGFYNLLCSHQMGSLSPSASDRIYCYRVVLIGVNNSGTSYSIFPARYLLSAIAFEEPEYEYLMRLKRSYETQQRFDRD